jgi:hypothetical protein
VFFFDDEPTKQPFLNAAGRMVIIHQSSDWKTMPFELLSAVSFFFLHADRKMQKSYDARMREKPRGPFSVFDLSRPQDQGFV